MMEKTTPLYHNLMEDVVLQYVDESIAAGGGCSCPLCKADVVAYTLNHLPPRYIRTEVGRMMVEISSYDVQFRTDVLALLGEAVKLVNSHPRHQQE
jgi:competence protein ComFB